MATQENIKLCNRIQKKLNAINRQLRTLDVQIIRSKVEVTMALAEIQAMKDIRDGKVSDYPDGYLDY